MTSITPASLSGAVTAQPWADPLLEDQAAGLRSEEGTGAMVTGRALRREAVFEALTALPSLGLIVLAGQQRVCGMLRSARG